MKWVKHIARNGEQGNASRVFYAENVKGRDGLGKIG
jgi:hypothetical protein